ncbi:MAG TPA: hypothetical protein VFH58_01085 [Acidimicrobiales bacterium]|nr:hypothetical protein [Acidimicrobiales bacterium]
MAAWSSPAFCAISAAMVVGSTSMLTGTVVCPLPVGAVVPDALLDIPAPLSGSRRERAMTRTAEGRNWPEG